MNSVIMGVVSSQATKKWEQILAPATYSAGNYLLSTPLDSLYKPLWLRYEDEFSTDEVHEYSISPHSSMTFYSHSYNVGSILEITITITAYNSINIAVSNLDEPGYEERVKIYALYAYQ